MELKDLQRERTLTEMIAERDTMVINLVQEVTRLKAEIAELKTKKEGK